MAEGETKKYTVVGKAFPVKGIGEQGSAMARRGRTVEVTDDGSSDHVTVIIRNQECRPGMSDAELSVLRGSIETAIGNTLVEIEDEPEMLKGGSRYEVTQEITVATNEEPIALQEGAIFHLGGPIQRGGPRTVGFSPDAITPLPSTTPRYNAVSITQPGGEEESHAITFDELNKLRTSHFKEV